VLPILSDPKEQGILIAWDGEQLHFAAHDVNSGGISTWIPGEGAEGEQDDEGSADVDWGGDDSPWQVFLWAGQAKEILKLFRLPAKLWRVPVTLKCTLTGDRLIIEREDGPKGERLLTLPSDQDRARKFPDIREIASRRTEVSTGYGDVQFWPARIGAFGQVRPHGALALHFGYEKEPVMVRVGTRFVGFLYQAPPPERPNPS
jgi:hypothetical protein